MNLFISSYIEICLRLSDEVLPWIFRSPESLSDLLLFVFVRRSSVVNFSAFLASSLEPLNQFQPDLAYSIYG
jgi:hypothetical protein